MNERLGAVRWRLLLAALVALTTLLVGAGTASAATGPHAGNRVGASTPLVVNTVGAAQHITAGQRLGQVLLQADLVVATGVAAKGAGALPDEAGALLGNADDVVVLGRQADTAVAKGWRVARSAWDQPCSLRSVLMRSPRAMVTSPAWCVTGLKCAVILVGDDVHVDKTYEVRPKPKVSPHGNVRWIFLARRQ